MKKFISIFIIIIIISLIIIGGKNFFFDERIDDYYLYVNKDLFDKKEIAENEVGWSKFSDAQDRVDEDVDNIVKELVQNNSNVNSNMTILYNNSIDVNNRNKVGLGPLLSYIESIDKSKDINEFIENSIKIEKDLGIDIFTLHTISKDFKDTSKNIVYFYPVTFDFSSSSEYYVNADYSRYLALFKKYRIRLLKEYGYDSKKARNVSSNLNEFYLYIANNSKREEELNDVDNLYNVITKKELQKIYSNINIDNYLQLLGIGDEKYFSIVDEGNYKAINSYLKNENLPLLKEYVRTKILESYGEYTSINYSNILNELNNELLGTEEEYDLEKDALANVESFFSYDIDKIYVSKHFTEEDKNYFESIINDILTYYEKEINSLDWMKDSTKAKAILKLKNMKINVGYPDNYPNYSNYYNLKKSSEKGSLIENVIEINKAMSKYQLELLKNDESIYPIPLTTVNAYYNPQDNSINFPAALIELCDKNSSYYEKLGSVGMIVAHEITHAFDNTGSKFDERGNRVEWWEKEDYQKYEQLQQKIIEYYSNYEVVSGLYVDGKKTVGENIADLGAINCIVEISKSKNASEKDFQTLFESFASLWASEYIESYQKMLLLQDNHSPDRIRVNAVLSSTDEFYKTYDVNDGDDMYVNSSERVKIW